MMKKIGLIVLMLFVFGSLAFAQIEENTETPEAILITEFGNVPNGQIKMELDNLFVQLQNDPSATAYIANFGAAREVARVEKLIRNQIRLRRFDASRVVFINGGTAEKLLTQFWIVPAGAEPPDFSNEEKSETEPSANKIAEFGKVTNGQIKMELDNLFVQTQNDPSATAYIINSGSSREIARVETLIRNQIKLRRYDATRMVFFSKATKESLKTEFWLVPNGATPPTP